MTPLVLLRCGGCRKLLAQVDAVPEDWTTTLYVPRCPKCDLPGVRRIVDYMFRVGVDGVPLGGDMPLWAVRDEVGRAASSGRPETVRVSYP